MNRLARVAKLEERKEQATSSGARDRLLQMLGDAAVRIECGTDWQNAAPSSVAAHALFNDPSEVASEIERLTHHEGAIGKLFRAIRQASEKTESGNAEARQ
jgi:hypothetical protein